MTDQSKTYIVKTLGCKANLYDSQLIEAEMQRRGWSPGLDSVALCIVNSCTVTDEADRQSRKLAARLGRDNPDAAVVVTGCAAEVDPERLANSHGIHYVIGNQNKPQMVDLILQKLENRKTGENREQTQTGEVLGTVLNYSDMLSRHPMDRDWPSIDESFSVPPVHLKGHSDKTRSFLKIQEGCNAFCTYCIIPYGRGPGKSLRPKEVIRQIDTLVGQGVKEVVITGTNIGDYGFDWSPDLSPGEEPPLTDLFEMIFDETKLDRLRVSSLDPTEVTPGLLRLMSNQSRFCPHFHISLQSPRTKILKLMKRKYDFERVKECLNALSQLRNPWGTPVFVGMDVITGFPGETDEEFELGYKALDELPWNRLHVFPYSERSGTPATRLPGIVPVEKRLRRARALNALSLERQRGNLQSTLDQSRSSGLPIRGVLIERSSSSRYQWAGYSPGYLRILIKDGSNIERNATIDVKPIAIAVDSAAGDVAIEALPLAKSQIESPHRLNGLTRRFEQDLPGFSASQEIILDRPE